ncbi:MAG: hypothetical protein H0X25_04845 [Acidobacteriales bacterium]|nr:hypothetical protein [Terriglobales bacterium]
MEMRTRTGGEREDQLSSSIEAFTAKLPSSGWLGAAFASIGASLVLKAIGEDDWALFVGQWAPTFLIIGVYNKMVKQHGSDSLSRAE